MKLLTLLAALLAGLFSLPAQAQGVTIGAAGAPDASAVLDLKSTTRGLLLPRLTGAERKAIVGPAAGLLIFQTNNGPGVYYYDGTNWRNLTDGSLPLPDMVSTLAGSTAGFADGTGPAAQFSSPEGVAADGSGNLYVTDRLNNRIRQIVVSTGVVTTLAGSGTAGFADGTGPAARFDGPFGIACDRSGNLFVADQNSHRIRQIVVATGVVTTLAGSGTAGFADGTGAAAQFSTPNGVACDGSGNVYVGDRANHRIRQIVAATGVVTTLAGSGAAGSADGAGPAAQFNSPQGVAADGSGNVYVADLLNYRIRKIVVSSGVVTSLAGNGAPGSSDGTGTAAQFSFPCGVACDASGNVYVADRGNHRIRQVVAATGVVTTLAGTGTGGFADGTAPAAQFNQPTGVACYPNGTVYVADRTNHRIRVIK